MFKRVEINKVILNEKKYVAFREALLDYLIKPGSFHKRNEQTVVTLNDEEIEMTLGRLMVNTLTVFPYFVGVNLALTKESLYTETFFSQKTYDKLMDKILAQYKLYNVPLDIYKAKVIEAQSLTTRIAGHANVRKGNSLGLNDFIRLYGEDQKFRDIVHVTIPKDRASASDVEEIGKELTKKIFSYFSDRTDSELYPYITSECGVNPRQLLQFMGFVGLKPETKGGVINHVVTDNFLVGLQSEDAAYVSAKGSRQAAIMNKEMVGRAGYLTQKLVLSMLDRKHDNSVHDCGTKHLDYYNVSSAAKLNKIVGMHYHELNEVRQVVSELKTVTEDSIELIGKTIGLRSAYTCACKDGVCATCYGRELSDINKNLHTGVLAVLLLTDELTQRMLSAKHLLTTNTVKIDWSEQFLEIFNVNMNQVEFKGIGCKVNIPTPDEDDFDEERNGYLVKEFSYTLAGGKKQINIVPPVELFISEKVHSMANGDTITLNSETFNKSVFSFDVENNEMSKSLDLIIKILESADHLGEKTLEGFSNKLIELIIENGLSPMYTHIAMLGSNLIRHDDDMLDRLDFSKETLDPMKIITVSKSIMIGEVCKALSFQRVSDQLANPRTYLKTKKSSLNAIFG